ncbi:MAG: hypothetical protein H3C26_14750 [Rhodocyclaceae bacterium]|nr:hypothetical protein [Rhodocyclaceae bacterium]
MDSRSRIFQARQQARAVKAHADIALFELHRRAVDALMGPDAESVVQKASDQIRKWEAGRLCSQHYIDAWRNILSMPPDAASKAILQPDGDGPALRQNTPFGFLSLR